MVSPRIADSQQFVRGPQSPALPPGSREVLELAIKGILVDAWKTQVYLSSFRGKDHLLQESRSGRAFTQEFWNVHAPRLIRKVNEGLSIVNSAMKWNSIVRARTLVAKYQPILLIPILPCTLTPRTKPFPTIPRRDARASLSLRSFRMLGAVR